MNNKLLITIVIPTFEVEYELYIPNNKKIGTIKHFILLSISELLKNDFSKYENEVRLVDRETGLEYQNDIYVKDSGIKNGSTLIII